MAEGPNNVKTVREKQQHSEQTTHGGILGNAHDRTSADAIDTTADDNCSSNIAIGRQAPARPARTLIGDSTVCQGRSATFSDSEGVTLRRDTGQSPDRDSASDRESIGSTPNRHSGSLKPGYGLLAAISGSIGSSPVHKLRSPTSPSSVASSEHQIPSDINRFSQGSDRLSQELSTRYRLSQDVSLQNRLSHGVVAENRLSYEIPSQSRLNQELADKFGQELDIRSNNRLCQEPYNTNRVINESHDHQRLSYHSPHAPDTHAQERVRLLHRTSHDSDTIGQEQLRLLHHTCQDHNAHAHERSRLLHHSSHDHDAHGQERLSQEILQSRLNEELLNRLSQDLSQNRFSQELDVVQNSGSTPVSIHSEPKHESLEEVISTTQEIQLEVCEPQAESLCYSARTPETNSPTRSSPTKSPTKFSPIKALVGTSLSSSSLSKNDGSKYVSVTVSTSSSSVKTAPPSLPQSGSCGTAHGCGLKDQTSSPKLTPQPARKASKLNNAGFEMGIKKSEVMDDTSVVQTVEILKRPGQTLGFYIREGNGRDRQDGVFISRIQMGTVAESNGLLHVADEILTVNNVKVGNMSLDDVVILMSIPKKLVLTIRTKKTSSKNASCPILVAAEEEPPPVVVLKKGRSSSVSAVEMTEKIEADIDSDQPSQSATKSHYDIPPHRPPKDLSPEKTTPGSSHFASVYISPQKAEARILRDGSAESASSNTDTSSFLKAAMDAAKEQAYVGRYGWHSVDGGPMDGSDRATVDGTTQAGQLPHYDSWGDREYLKYTLGEGGYKRFTSGRPTAMRTGYTPPRTGTDYYSDSDAQGGSGVYSYAGDPYAIPPGASSSRNKTTITPSVPVSVDERGRLPDKSIRGLLHAKTKYGHLSRSHSPECYNSDSEIASYLHSKRADFRPGFASDHETYTVPSAYSDYSQYPDDNDVIYAIPRIPLSSSSELQHLLHKFNTLSQELQHEQSRLKRQLSAKRGQVPLSLPRSSGVPSSDSDDYATMSGAPGSSSSGSRGSPGTIRRSMGIQTSTSAGSRGISRKHSADSLMSYVTYQKPETDGRIELIYHHGQQHGVQQQYHPPPILHHQHSTGHVTFSHAQDVNLAIPHKQQQQHPMSVIQQQPHTAATLAGVGGKASTHLPPVPHHKSSKTSSYSGAVTLDKSRVFDTDGKAITRPSSRYKDLHFAKKPLQITYDDYEPYRVDIRRRLELDRAVGLDGILNVHILTGQGLKSARTTLRDLYCVVAIDNENKARTMIRTGAVNFDWDEAFDVEMDNSKDLSFLVYNWDPNFRHRLCFHGTVLLPGFADGQRMRKLAIRMEPKGILYIELLYKEPAVSLQRLPSRRKNALFGVDLETIIKHENTGLNVPLLVKKCIEEIDIRGLESVGIYRLCGSVKRKAELRDAFERNAAAVDLSQDYISDIHVITGVLKDYLRELPEPLVTNALYQMLLDALSVRLPDDPDGSAKLMLSILECLPKANQDTMAIVLSHLKHVTGKSNVNKMTCHNIAVCFGPVLLCPAPTSVEVTLDFKKHIEVLRYLLEIWSEDGDGDYATMIPEDVRDLLLCQLALVMCQQDYTGKPKHERTQPERSQCDLLSSTDQTSVSSEVQASPKQISDAEIAENEKKSSTIIANNEDVSTC